MPFAYSVSHPFHTRQLIMRPPFVLGILTTALFAAAPAHVLVRPNLPTEQPELAVPTTPAPNPPASEQQQQRQLPTLQDLPPGFQEVPPQIKQQIAVWMEPFKQLLAKIYR